MLRQFVHLQDFTLVRFIELIEKGYAPIVTRDRLTPAEMTQIKQAMMGAAPEGCDFALFTSGSSGIPKLACLSFESLLENAHLTSSVLGITSRCVLHAALPPWHIGGLMLRMRGYVTGATFVHSMGPDVTDTSLVPTQLKRLLKAGEDLSRFRSILLGGAPADTELLEMAEGLPLHTLYGLTEMTGTVAINGKLLDGIECKAEDQIYLKSHRLFSGYLICGKLHKQAEWHPTGDIGTYEQGTLHVSGRKDRIIISGGENIDPKEIEIALLKVPGVTRCYVRGEAHDDWGQAVIAYVDGEKDSQKILNQLRDHIPGFKVPKKVLPYELLGGKFNFK